MPKYIYDRKRDMMVDKATGLPMLNQAERAAPPVAPRVFGDLPGYRSPIDGSWIDGRRARKYDLEKNNCVDANDFAKPDRGLKNERFAEKHNLKHLLK